jgi:glyoxylase-like metal-dependent hydrolase (beta-lactamase superfamily II)
MKLSISLLFAGALLLSNALPCSIASAQPTIDNPNGANLERGELPQHWLSGGPRCMEMPEWQVHEYNPNFYIMRQSGCSDYEKPFVYVMFGATRALVLDTGSRNGNFAPNLQRLVHNWLLRNGRANIPLIVVHSHSHSDHVAGDAAIQQLNDPALPIAFVAATAAADQAFFGVAQWPEDNGSVDLGGRIVDMIPLPGHDEASIALYDRNTGILLSGDSIYPGRLYIHDLAAFQRSTERLLRFTADKPVAHILGCHIEQTRTPYLEYPIGTLYQPDEHELALGRGALLELEEALQSLHGEARQLALRDFTLWPVRSQQYGMKPKTAELFRKTQEQQKQNMWDQPR